MVSRLQASETQNQGGIKNVRRIITYPTVLITACMHRVTARLNRFWQFVSEKRDDVGTTEIDVH